MRQLSYSGSDPPFRGSVQTTYDQREKEAKEKGFSPRVPTLQESVDLIHSITENHPAIIFIDALDECDHTRRHELLEALDAIIHESSSQVKVFVSSRDDNDIVCHLTNSPNVYIRASDNGLDIERFVRSEVDQAVKTKRLLSGRVSEELKRRITTTLIDGAQGM